MNCTVTKDISLNTESVIKARNACVANLIHSLDAQILSNIVMQFNKLNLYIDTIHDCFLISIKHHDLLLELYHKEIYNIYINRNKILSKYSYINDEFLNKLPKENLSTYINKSRTGLRC